MINMKEFSLGGWAYRSFKVSYQVINNYFEFNEGLYACSED